MSTESGYGPDILNRVQANDELSILLIGPCSMGRTNDMKMQQR